MRSHPNGRILGVRRDVPGRLLLLAMLVAPGARAATISDIANTRHNLSVSGPGAVRATTETELCVFCHTPHAATASPGAPLWNRQLSNQTYTPYTSSSLDAQTISGQLNQPAGSSKLCLSCHDGTLALGAVNVLGGQHNVNISLLGTAPDRTMPPGAGAQTGFTRDLGIDLRNDHPISLTYDTTLASLDGELHNPDSSPSIGVGAPGFHPPIPLEPTAPGAEGQVQCGSCHDPHVHDIDLTKNIKFLRLNRFQEVNPLQGQFNPDADMVCLGCHDKQGWATSAHALSSAANETYTLAGAELREFPPGLPVWQAGCLNCHDTHTVQGARRLLREGTDSPATPKNAGESAIEETCYQCHALNAAINNAGGEVPNVQDDFLLPRHMPITSADQVAGVEVHDITDADLGETQALLGKGNLNNRHAECTDCHNPHRVMKNRLFNGAASTVAGTHDHSAPHSNIASGVLRGVWGVEPVYGNANFLSLPSTYLLKEGDGGSGAGQAVNNPYLTREYQLCLKCHSDFGYTDNAVYPIGSRPNLGESGGGTPSGTNGLSQYTNQAMEFQAPLFHKGEVTTTDSGAGSGFSANNHRSWHPVVDDTGRNTAVRQASANAWLAPWSGAVGSQTMYCSDCHGSNTAGNTVVPPGGENGRPWGPHGSTQDFILKGTWNAQSGGNTREVPATDPNNGLCFKCHDFQTYADRDGDDKNSSGFSGEKSNNLHAFHADKIEKMHCMWCHTAVPHGWKNKALLVNLNDVGPEAGLPPNTEVPIHSSLQVLDEPPYYRNAKLKIITFAQSGQWQDSNCGSASGTPDVGKEWMEQVCENPP